VDRLLQRAGVPYSHTGGLSIPSAHVIATDAAVPGIDANGLALAAAIAEAGSLTAGLGVTQSALTKQLQRLERQLGVALFVRDVRDVRPTEYGESLLPRARTVRAQLRQAVEAIGQLRGRREGRVTVALSHLATLTLMPEAMRRFRAAWPDVQVGITPPPFPDRFAGLREGAPDFAVATRPVEPLGREYATVPLGTTTVVVVCRPGHPLVRSRELRELVGADWVLPSVQITSAQALRRAFARARLPEPRIAVACETLTGLELLVAGGELLGLVPLEVHRLRASRR
jgi:DNA-binding transcriptional LysR family regulator